MIPITAAYWISLHVHVVLRLLVFLAYLAMTVNMIAAVRKSGRRDHHIWLIPGLISVLVNMPFLVHEADQVFFWQRDPWQTEMSWHIVWDVSVVFSLISSAALVAVVLRPWDGQRQDTSGTPL